jgi:hypothetical protein
MQSLLPKKRSAVPGKAPQKSDAFSARALSEAELEARRLADELSNTDGWLTRNEVCDLLRCSPQTVKNYEHRGKLHPRNAIRKDRSDSDRQMRVYDPKELAALPPRNPGGEPSVDVRAPGELAARAFELFRKGLDLDEVVIELRETTDRVDHLHERWLNYSRGRHVITVEAKKALEQAIGKFDGVTDLVEKVAKIMKSVETIGSTIGKFETAAELIELFTTRFGCNNAS